MDAFRSVLERQPETRLEIVGPLAAAPKDFILENTEDPRLAELGPMFDGDYVASLRAGLEPHVAERVSFVGERPYREMVEHYRRADIFVCPSVWNEPFGLPVVEAMACGLPVVAARSGAIGEIVRHGETGLLVERGSATELADAMLALLSDGSRRESMGRAGRARVVDAFSWERVVEDLESLYDGAARPGS